MKFLEMLKKRSDVLFIGFFISFSLWSSMVSNNLAFEIKGEKEVELAVFDQYIEKGAYAEYCSFFRCSFFTNIKVETDLDTNKVGTYEVLYTFNYSNKENIKKRIVHVVDKESPNIVLNGDLKIYLNEKENFVEPGYSAWDNYDGDLTNQVKIEKTSQAIYYRVFDSSGNSFEIKRDIYYRSNNVDKSKRIFLNGSSVVYLERGDVYSEVGVTSLDDSVVVNTIGVVDTQKVGRYDIKYEVVDSTSKKNLVLTRKVYVYDLNTTNKEDYIKSLNYYIEMKGYAVSVGYVSLVKDDNYFYNEEKKYFGASLVKMLDALYVYEKLDVTLELRKLVADAISLSSNSAHEILVNKIGKTNLRKYAKKIGLKSNIFNNSSYGNTTVLDQISCWKYLYDFINKSSLGEELKNFFINSKSNYLLFDGAPVIMHKYGYSDYVFHDTGIVYDYNPYILVFLSSEGKGDYRNIIQDLSKKIYRLNKLV